MVDLHVSSPGLEEAYERAKMTGEMYLTGQGAFLFTKLFVNDMMPEKGLLSSDMLAVLNGGEVEPSSGRGGMVNPLVGNYRTKDGRHIQLMFLQGDRYCSSTT